MNVREIARANSLVEKRNRLLDLRTKMHSTANIEFNIYFSGHSTVNSKEFCNITSTNNMDMTEMIGSFFKETIATKLHEIEEDLKDMGVTFE